MSFCEILKFGKSIQSHIYHFGKDKKSHTYQQLISSKDCLDKCSKGCFSFLDTANTKHQLRIKESLYITCLKPILNKKNINTSHQFLSNFIFFCSFSLLCLRLIWFYRLSNLFDSYFQLFLYLIITLLKQLCKRFSFY